MERAFGRTHSARRISPLSLPGSGIEVLQSRTKGAFCAKRKGPSWNSCLGKGQSMASAGLLSAWVSRTLLLAGQKLRQAAMQPTRRQQGVQQHGLDPALQDRAWPARPLPCAAASAWRRQCCLPLTSLNIELADAAILGDRVGCPVIAAQGERSNREPAAARQRGLVLARSCCTALVLELMAAGRRQSFRRWQEQQRHQNSRQDADQGCAADPSALAREQQWHLRKAHL